MAVTQSPFLVELDVGPDVVPFALEATIVFIILESVMNAAKHAQAKNLRIKVWIEGQRLFAEIEDDGVGGATGLRRLRERARVACGTIDVDSPSGVGTLIRAEIPLAFRNPW
jgi:signal transduction histidine kinase